MDEGVAAVAAAARKTLTWQGVISGGRTVTGGPADGTAAEFIFDPASGRYAIGPPVGLLLEGNVEYGWAPGAYSTKRELPAGRWMHGDVRLALQICIDACLTATPGEPLSGARAFEIELDRDFAEALMENGLNPRWTRMTGHVVIDGMGYIRDLAISLGDGAETTTEHWRMRWFDVPVTIGIPSANAIIGADHPIWEEHERHG